MRRARSRAFGSLGFAAVVAVALVISAYRYATTNTSFPAQETHVVIPSGATGRDVARLLAENGVVPSALAFEVLARVEGERTSIKAGAFAFAAHRPMTAVLAQVVAGTGQVAVWVTVPEGYTAREIASACSAAGLGSTGAFDAAFLDAPIVVTGVRVRNYEGFLFPQTYLVPLGSSPADVAKIMFGEFERELPADAVPRARSLGLTVPQVVAVASLVEREARFDSERALMAGVYYNRLRLGMPLQVDATMEYTFAHHKDVITLADLARDSPYNTYKHRGLPPTPIANPGRASLLAAFHPKRSAYLYYVATQNGHSAFSRTLAGHDANVERYVK